MNFMPALMRKILIGAYIGFRSRNVAFLSVLGIAVAYPVLSAILTSIFLPGPFSLSALLSIYGVPFTVAVGFMFYLVTITALQVYHRAQGDPAQARALMTQVNVVVLAVIFALLAAPLFR